MDWNIQAAPTDPKLADLSWRTMPDVARAAFLGESAAQAVNFEALRNRFTQHFYPANVESLDGGHHLNEPVLAARHLTHLTIGYVKFGTAARVDIGDIRGYHVNVPLHGTVLSRCGDQHIAASAPRTAAVFSPNKHSELTHWDFDAAQLCIKLKRSSVEAELAGLLGRTVTRPINFQIGFELGGAAGREWVTVLSALVQHCGHESDRPQHHAVMELLERSLIAGLLMSQQHSYTSEMQVGAPALSSGVVRTVVELVEAAPESHYTLSDLARMANVSTRTLQAAFQRELETSPTAYVRQVRLDRARYDLQLRRGLVSDVAYHWGFTNLGRFASWYHERFGEMPSATLSRV